MSNIKVIFPEFACLKNSFLSYSLVFNFSASLNIGFDVILMLDMMRLEESFFVSER